MLNGKISYLKFLSVVFVVIVTLSGCRGSVNVADLFSHEQTETDYDIHIASEKLRTLNPALSFDEGYISISRLIYSGLFRLDESLMPVNDLAKDYTYSEDKKSLEIRVRNDVVWHDGEKFTAEDVKFSIDVYKYLASYGETPYAGYVSNIKSAVVSQEDPYTLTVYFGNDAAVGTENLIFPILPSHIYATRNSLASFRSDKENFEPVGTGMYKVEEYDSLKSLVLTANEKYYGTKAENRLIFDVLPSIEDGFNLTDVNDINLVFSNTYDRETYVADKNLVNTEYPSNSFELIAFNMNGQLTGNKNFRQAIAHLINVDTLIESVYYQNGIEVDSIFYPGYFGLENEGDKYEYDSENAKSLLRKAGLKDTDEDGYLEDKYGEDAEIKILIDKNNPMRSAAALIIKDEIEKCGVTVIIDTEENEAYEFKLANRDYDILIATCTISERYDLRPLIHSNYNNIAGFSNNAVDTFAIDMVSGLSASAKSQSAARLKGILIDEIPYYPILLRTNSVMSTNEFKGELMPIFNYMYNNSENWCIEKPIEKN